MLDKNSNSSYNYWPVARRVEVESKVILATGAVWMALHERVHWACLQSHCFSSRARLAVTSSCGGTSSRNTRLKTSFTKLNKVPVELKHWELYLIVTAECKTCNVFLIVLKLQRTIVESANKNWSKTEVKTEVWSVRLKAVTWSDITLNMLYHLIDAYLKFMKQTKTVVSDINMVLIGIYVYQIFVHT